MKKTPLTIGIILLVAGLVGIVFNQFSVAWMWLLIVLGIVVIIWTIVISMKDKSVEKK